MALKLQDLQAFTKKYVGHKLEESFKILEDHDKDFNKFEIELKREIVI